MLLQFYSAVTLQHPFILYPWHVLGVLGRPPSTTAMNTVHMVLIWLSHL